MRIIWILGLVVVLVGCASSKKSAGGASAYANYQENVSSSLPSYPDFREAQGENSAASNTESVQAVDAQLEQVQQQLISKNETEPYFNGYSVLVFSGINREQAFKTQDELIEYFPDITPQMQYQQPRYLVKVGRYAHKIEAQKNFAMIKSQFPTARIIQDRFQREEFKSLNEINEEENDDEGQN
ncbi:hypothetical protein PBT90_18655 [Algoriphagus halophytocola]|uniref:SPOR domain-containing protein n=1 Tax=Algoriphagus halophytocola TaxID=2991499 RepID=A0ABY6MEF7_9BACT|nr:MULTISPECIES: hypothetical protein [unclassified Algoriphagus]UZD21538.1 hypothetical protein OM944_12785 [Algoriphagus sp. TR-M5]WBL42750.1 hypothetical protein PBT90_18655 [Algoriphagus sp. TR-M9]